MTTNLLKDVRKNVQNDNSLKSDRERNGHENSRTTYLGIVELSGRPTRDSRVLALLDDKQQENNYQDADSEHTV
jgi:hypothetical protein